MLSNSYTYSNRVRILKVGEKSVILFHSQVQYSDMFSSYHCTIKQCNTSAGTYIYYITRGIVTYLKTTIKALIVLVHALYFVSPIDAHYIFCIILLSIYSIPFEL